AVSGLSDFLVGLVSAVPNLVAAVAMVLVGAHSDRTGERLFHITASATTAGGAFLASAYLHSPALIVFALSMAAAGLLSSQGPFWTLPSVFLSGSAAAVGIGLINSVANLAGFIGPYTIGLLKGASGSFHSGLLLLALVPLTGAALALWLRRAPALARASEPIPASI